MLSAAVILMYSPTKSRLQKAIADLLAELNVADRSFHPEGISLLLQVDGSGAIIVVGSDEEIFQFDSTGQLFDWIQTPVCERDCSRIVTRKVKLSGSDLHELGH